MQLCWSMESNVAALGLTGVSKPAGILCWAIEMKVNNILTCADQYNGSEVRQGEGRSFRHSTGLCWAPATCDTSTRWRLMQELAPALTPTCCIGMSFRVKRWPCWDPGKQRLLIEWSCIRHGYKFIPAIVARSGTYYFVKRNRWHTEIGLPDVGDGTSTASAHEKTSSTNCLRLASPLSHCQSQHQLELSDTNITLTCLGSTLPIKEQRGISELPET